jgi:hypothetical protein
MWKDVRILLARIMHHGTLRRPKWVDFRDEKSSQSA